VSALKPRPADACRLDRGEARHTTPATGVVARKLTRPLSSGFVAVIAMVGRAVDLVRAHAGGTATRGHVPFGLRVRPGFHAAGLVAPQRACTPTCEPTKFVPGAPR
jgi:hypothetical protein